MSKIKLVNFVLMFVTVVVFVIIYLSWKHSTEAGRGIPYSTEYVEVSYKEFNYFLDEKNIDLVYMTSTNPEGTNIYAKRSNGNLIYISNPNLDSFTQKIYDSGAKVRSLSLFKTREEIEERAKSKFQCIVIVTFFVYFLFFLWCSRLKIGIRIKEEQKNRLSLYGINSLGGLSSFGELKPITKETQKSEKTFNDIAGLKEVKKDMIALVDFLVNKDKYTEMGAKLPKGVILYGPPGTGKTLLAKAVANEAGVPFHYMSGSEFIEKYVGVGAQRVRELFEKARKTAPCIVFIDEIDTIGSKRYGSQHSEDRKTINALLTEMDGFKESENIIVIGATNRLEDLDSALTRPGRFTDKFCVSLPETAKERREVIDLYIANKKIDETVDLDVLAKELIGFSPAKIEALLNEAAIIAVQNDKPYISREELDKALYKILLNGHEREDQSERDASELNIVAWHEAGHALMGILNGKEVTKVTIVSSTSGAGGVTFTTPKRGALHSISDLKNEVKELYGGRIAELIYFNDDKSLITTGASNDIERATDIINAMTEDYAMTDEFGLLNMRDVEDNQGVLIDYKVKLSKELEQETYDILMKNYDTLKRIADSLLENETITSTELKELVY